MHSYLTTTDTENQNWSFSLSVMRINIIQAGFPWHIIHTKDKADWNAEFFSTRSKYGNRKKALDMGDKLE